MSESKKYLDNMLQNEQEIEQLALLFKEQGVTRFLEIGSKYGGSLWRIAEKLPEKSYIVSVDLPRATVAWPDSEPSLKACVQRLCNQGHDARIIWGDSTDSVVIQQIEQLAPFDAIFIDANHTREFVTRDWQNYGPLARIVAFHDINWKRDREWRGKRIDVPEFWDEIKQGHHYVEFRHDPKQKDFGIGVIWN